MDNVFNILNKLHSMIFTLFFRSIAEPLCAIKQSQYISLILKWGTTYKIFTSKPELKFDFQNVLHLPVVMEIQ